MFYHPMQWKHHFEKKKTFTFFRSNQTSGNCLHPQFVCNLFMLFSTSLQRGISSVCSAVCCCTRPWDQNHRLDGLSWSDRCCARLGEKTFHHHDRPSPKLRCLCGSDGCHTHSNGRTSCLEQPKYPSLFAIRFPFLLSELHTTCYGDFFLYHEGNCKQVSKSHMNHCTPSNFGFDSKKLAEKGFFTPFVDGCNQRSNKSSSSS